MDKDKSALVLCLDQNKENKYEYECLHCIKCWLNKTNYLSGIDILIYIKDNVNISINTLNALQKHKNVFIRRYTYPASYKHNHILLNKLYCWFIFEKFETKYQYGIYADLDLYLMRALPAQDAIFNDKNVFCVYSEPNNNEIVIYKRFESNQQKGIYTFNTEFIINNRKNQIFEKLVQLIDDKGYETFFNANFLYENDMYYYEEGIYDYAFYINIINDKNSNFIDLKQISGTANSFFMHKHIRTFSEYVKFCKTNVIR